MRRFMLGFALALTVGACTHRPGDPQAVSSSKSAVITREEIERSRAVTALDAIQRLRPFYLSSRGANSVLLDPQLHAVVFLNEQEYGDITVLRNVQANDVQEIRYYNGTEATQKFGAQYGGGVIQLVSRVE